MVQDVWFGVLGEIKKKRGFHRNLFRCLAECAAVQGSGQRLELEAERRLELEAERKATVQSSNYAGSMQELLGLQH